VIGLVSPFWRKQQQRIYRLGISRCHHLRRQLAYYVVKHGFEIGDYSHGWPDVRTFGGRLKVGKYCSFAKGATFVLGGQHPSKAVTTFSLENVFGGEKPASRQESRGDIVVGSDVWIASNSLILSGVTIGDGAVVGLGSVVVQDVPPYSIVFGSPARVISKRFPDDVIAELLELRWWDLPAKEVQALRPLLEETDIAAFLSACRKSRGLPPKHCGRPKASSKTLPAEAVAEPADVRSAQVVAIVKRESPTFTSADMEMPFDRLGIDSMGMLIIRTELDALAGTTIDDRRWAGILTPSDLVNALGATSAPGRRYDTEKNATERRRYVLNMPQMALGGLSESWLFKEFGDIHWSMLAKGLKRPSHMLEDENGNRLYATFVRFQLDASCALATFKENERVEFDASMCRYGAGMYFSDATASGESGSIRARLASSFSRVEAEGSNTSLVKGLPEIPAKCNIPALPELPEFARDYRARRSQPLGQPIFEREYEIIPSHDINGVGLLYFAAYPTINDICVTRYAGRSFATQYSTVHRDVFYYGNSDPDDILLYRLHRWSADDDTIHMEGSISRKSDGNLIAGVVARKVRIDRRNPSRNSGSR
jgi:probable biosynthetic protein (TIGR04098 family)